MTASAAIKVGLAGLFRLEVYRSDGSKRLDSGWFTNLVLDAGLNRLGTGGVGSYCRVGTGSTSPAAGQTALVNQVGYTSSIQQQEAGYDSVGNLYGYLQRRFRFAPGSAAGVLAEVGIGWGDSGNTLFSRALILDDEGDPTTITVLGDETLDVTYELRLYRPTVDATYNVTINGEAHAVVMRAAQMSSWGNAALYLVQAGLGTINFLGGGSVTQYGYGAGDLGAVTVPPGGSQLGGGEVSFDGGYSNNSYQRNFRATWPITSGASAFANIGWNTNGGYFKNSFSPAIPKTNARELVLHFAVSWARKTL